MKPISSECRHAEQRGDPHRLRRWRAAILEQRDKMQDQAVELERQHDEDVVQFLHDNHILVRDPVGMMPVSLWPAREKLHCR